MNKYGVDYNLSKHLEALLLHKNVTLASKAVGITQSAMSNSLSKIRDHFNDQLLVRTKEGYELTCLAEKLLPKVSTLMENFIDVFDNSDSFNASTDQYTFNIAVSDYAGFVFGPDLLFHFQENFPKIIINLRSIEKDFSLEDLSQGLVDIAIATSFDENFPKSLKRKRLNTDSFGVAGCGDHLEEFKDLSLQNYTDSSHLFTRPKSLDTNIIDRELNKLNIKRNIVSEIPHFSIAIRSTLRTPNLVTLPYKILIESAKFLPLKVYPLPLEIMPIKNTLLWHGKSENHKPSTWLREHIFNLYK